MTKVNELTTNRNIRMDHMLLPLVVDKSAGQLVHGGRDDLQPGVGRRKRPLQLLDLRLEHREARHPASSRARVSVRGPRGKTFNLCHKCLLSGPLGVEILQLP